MNASDYLGRQYADPPCWALVTDVLMSEAGLMVTAYKTVNSSIRSIASAFRLALHKSPDGLTQLTEPVDLCIVLLGKSPKLGIHHCGVYWQGSVLHALPNGNVLQDMASIGDQYQTIEFWGWA